MLKRFRRNPLSMLAAAIVIGFIAMGVLASVIAPYGFAAIDLKAPFQPPSAGHLLGTDSFGRDLLSRIMYGARASLVIAVGSTAIGMVAGVAVGSFAGYVGGWRDEISMRSMDVILAFPPVVLGLALATTFGPSLLNLIFIIAAFQVPVFARVSRSAVLSIKAKDYVTAATTLGQTDRRIFLGHVLPNMSGPLVVLASLTVPGAVVIEAALSFLGLGVQPPTPSWGNLVFDGTRFLLQQPWLAFFPGLTIVLVVLSFNVVGDGLRDALDPRSTR